MNSSTIYVPLIKGKKNDLIAVGKVFNDVRQLIKPFVEAMPLDFKNPSVEKHVFKLCDQIRKNLPLGEIFVDFYLPDEIIPDGTNATLHGFALLKAFDRPVTPVFGLDRNDQLWDSLGIIAQDFGKGFCFRLSRDDLAEYSLDDVWAQIIERTAQMRLPQNQIDLLIDLKHVDGDETVALEENIISFLFHNPSVAGYRSIIIAGSSALKTVSTIQKDKTAEVIRQELHLWSSLWLDMPDGVKPIFGDYGVVHPDFTDQVNNKNINAKIRYTIGDKIIYFRGHGLYLPVPDFDQYHVLAGRVKRDIRFAGRDYSYGDKYIDDCAQRCIKHGAPATWIVADMNRHVCYTANQMIRLTRELAFAATKDDADLALAMI